MTVGEAKSAEAHDEPATIGRPDRRARLRERWRTFVQPRDNGLPNALVIATPLLLLAAIFIGLVAFGVTGSSTGYVHSLVSSEDDADLLVGDPQAIRSDEWFVQTSWTISQVEQGLPLRNETFPGGMDATVQHDLPALDWSIAFRPHLLGFLFLPLDQAMAVKWWLPGFALLALTYLFTVTLLPRRPGTALALSTAFFFSPFFQWWYLSMTFYAPAWALLVMTAVVWCLRSRGNVGRWVLAAVLAYLTVTLGTGIYVPFIVPVAFVALAFSIGAVLMPAEDGARFLRRLGRVGPVLIAGAVGGAILVVWLLTRWSTIVGFTSTVYPGERLQPVGLAGRAEAKALLSGPLSLSLEASGGQAFGSNSSEASTFMLPGMFLSVVLLWLFIDNLRRRRGVDWLSVCLLAVGALLLAYMFVPGWDSISHLLLLDRTTYGRARIGFGLLSVVVVVVLTMRLRERDDAGIPRVPRWVVAVATGLAAASVGWIVLAVVRQVGPATLVQLPTAALVVVTAVLGLFVASVWLYGVGAFAWGTTALLVASLVSTAGVNPLYRGVLDLRETAVAQEMERLNAQAPGEWVGIATTPLPTMLLVETGIPSFNGFQSAPADDMWDQIDPAGRYEGIWNRLANVSWVAGEGDPQPRNPAPDQIQMTFDSCATFAQENVRWVLAEEPLTQSCLTLVSTIEEGPSTMRIYEVESAD